MEYLVKKTKQAPEINGKVEGPVWAQAAVGAMKEAIAGGDPLLKTAFRLLYDDNFLYAGYTVEDKEIVATFTDHDESLYQEDVVEIFMSPTGSTKVYYEFNFSPKEVVFDAIVLNDDGRAGHGRGKDFMPLKRWDCEGLMIATHIEKSGNWAVTVKIPFVKLHLADNRAPISGTRWRANLFRIEYGGEKPEYSAWSAPLICDFHTSEKFGTLVFE